jgi:hypothetical protein
MTMAYGNNPGDGKTNPFGDGAGKGTGGNVPGNDFTRNPQGSGSGGATPRNLNVSRPQPMSTPESQGINPADAIAGGNTAADDAGPGVASGQDTGVGTVGSGAKPFRLGG